MSLSQTFQHLKLATLFGGVLGLGIGCVINLEPITPCDSGSNNKLDDQGDCECRIGYEWCDPDDPDNLNCCDDDIGEGTTGSPTTTSSTTTGDGDGDPATTTGDGDGDGDGDACPPSTPPPESCLPDEEGLYYCTNVSVDGPECSQFFICVDGVWVEDAQFMEDSCTFDGWDFAYGCVDEDGIVFIECGEGSGEACSNSDPWFCVDDDVIGSCEFGKETWESCQAFCENEGIDGQLYEYGECDASIPDDVACFCCDSGEPDCPI